jgi:2-O-methyltransferase
MVSLYHKVLGRINARRKIPTAVTDLFVAVKKYLPANPSILEAGAHMGFDTYGLAKIWPKAEIYAFEPVPKLYTSLVQRVSSLKNVKTFCMALGEQNDTVAMYVSGGDSTGSSSILKPTVHLARFPGVTFDHTIPVPVKRMDDWAKDQNISRIDFIWLDMQGYEVYALKGAGELLKTVSVIYTELCASELYAGLTTRDEYIRFLNGTGFELISSLGEDEITEGIFINRGAISDRKRRLL